MTFFKNIFIIILVTIIGYKYESEWKNIIDTYNLSSMLDLNNESYSKDILLTITKEKEIEIINNLVLIITKNIINEANQGHRNYYWEDKKYYLNKDVLEILLIKLSDKLPNVKITNEYYKSLRLIFDWN
jgi:hypothetical protein